MSYVNDRSPRPTLECFLSSKLCKGCIMLAKGKAPKVLPAVQVNQQLAAWEPVVNIPEGSGSTGPRY